MYDRGEDSLGWGLRSIVHSVPFIRLVWYPYLREDLVKGFVPRGGKRIIKKKKKKKKLITSSTLYVTAPSRRNSYSVVLLVPHIHVLYLHG